MIAHWVSRRRWPLSGAAVAALVGLAALLVATRAGATMPYDPIFEFTAISSDATGANADITFRTSLPAGNHILGTYGLEVPDNSWNIAGHSNQLDGKVTVVGTMTVNLDPDGNCNDGDSGSAQNYGPFPLLDQNPGGGGPYAMWGGRITDFGDGNPNTYWDLALTVEQLGTGYTIDGFVTSVILPAGNAACTPQVLTLTMCGRANPTPTATVCGSGNDTVVMTNPAAAGCYLWRLVTLDESGQHSATRYASVSIGGTACTPTPTPTVTSTATPTATPNCSTSADTDGDGFLNSLECHVGTNVNAACAATTTPNDENPDAVPTDFNDDRAVTGADLSIVSADIGKVVPPAAVRGDIAPAPSGDSSITAADLSAVSSVIGSACGAAPTPTPTPTPTATPSATATIGNNS